MPLSYKQQKFLNRLTFGLSIMGPSFTLGDIRYNFKQSFRSFRRFFKSIWRYRGFDYQSTLDVLSVCLEMHLEAFREGDHFQEIEETRLPKEAKIERCLLILKNIKEDNYSERCGYDSNYDVFFVPVPGKDYSTMESNKTPEQEENNKRAIDHADRLREAEWNELMDLLKSDLRSFWT